MGAGGREYTYPEWQTDEKTYREEGSYRFTPEQRASEILVLDVEITSYSHERYENKKSNPNASFYGYATVFHGSSVRGKIPLEFVRQRVVYARNNQITDTSFLLSSHYSTLASLRTLGNFGFDPPDWFTSLAKLFDTPYPGMFTENCEIQPFDLLGHRETVCKVKTMGQSQFLFRCAWMLPITFDDAPIAVLGNDPTDGEDEYPDPKNNPSDDPYRGNDGESEKNPDSDPWDYGDNRENNEFDGADGPFDWSGENGYEVETPDGIFILLSFEILDFGEEIGWRPYGVGCTQVGFNLGPNNNRPYPISYPIKVLRRGACPS
jgi:hypothetical protein